MPTRSNPLVAMALALSCASCAGAGDASAPEGWAPPPPEAAAVAYPLDGESRRAPGSGAPRCPVVQLLEYRGDIVAYRRPLEVNPFFRERLQQFEIVVHEVAVQVYGRPPSAIRHFGAYNCRRIRGKAKLSEHAFGNALDVSGFEFEPAPDARGPAPGAFRISLEEHWGARRGVARHHARFLRELTRALAARPDIFRGMLGPGAPGHDDHFHLDVGPHRYMDVGP